MPPVSCLARVSGLGDRPKLDPVFVWEKAREGNRASGRKGEDPLCSQSGCGSSSC